MSSKAIIIGAGPSVEKFKQLKILAKSEFEGIILCTDYMLEHALNEGITPDKFKDYFVFATEDAYDTIYLFDKPIIKKHSKSIKCILLSVHPKVKEQCINLFQETKIIEDTFETSILANVGDITFYVAKEIMKIDKVGGIGFDHSFESDFVMERFPKKYLNDFWNMGFNPVTKSEFWLNPIYDYFTRTFKEYLNNSNNKFYNLSEQGSLFGKNIIFEKLEWFINA